MPLLLLPLLLLVVVAAWLVLLPLSLRQRYRYGSARRRARGWVLRVNAWGLLLSLPGFLAAAWMGTAWSAQAPRDALVGLAVGGLVGGLGLALTRFEHSDGQFHYTPNRWLVLALTALLALRIVLGLWWAWRRAGGDAGGNALWQHFMDVGGLWAVAGVLLGYAAAYGWGLHRRYARSFR